MKAPAMRTLNWLKPIGYNLIMAEIRRADFTNPADPANSGMLWITALADVAQDRFKVIFEGWQPNLRLLRGDRTCLDTYPAVLLSAMAEHGDITEQDLGSALWVAVRYMNWIMATDGGQPA